MGEHLLSVGPKSQAEDEMIIGKAYRSGQRQSAIFFVAIAATAYYTELKYVLALGFILVLFSASSIENRVYDLCIRLRRTNILLSQNSGEQSK